MHLLIDFHPDPPTSATGEPRQEVEPVLGRRHPPTQPFECVLKRTSNIEDGFECQNEKEKEEEEANTHPIFNNFIYFSSSFLLKCLPLQICCYKEERMRRLCV